MSTTGRLDIIAPANRIFKQSRLTHARYVLLKGSAGSGKSRDTAQLYVLRLLSQPGRNLLCIRKTEESNRSSTFAELKSSVSSLGLDSFFEFCASPPFIRCVLNGNSVLFRGSLDERQREKLKSITFPSGKLTDIWIEEATELDEADFELLDDRLRGKLPDGLFYQIRLTFNPVSESHWIKHRFFDFPDKNVFICNSTYLDNRFIDSAFSERMERRKITDPEGYRVYALGEWGVSGGQYFSEWRESIHTCEPFPVPESWRRYVSLDYGLDMLAAYLFALDPEGRAYVLNEVYSPGLIVSEAAHAVLDAFGNEDIYSAFAPPDLWNRRQDTGKSASDIFAENGLTLTRAENDRVAGWLNLHEWLMPYADENGMSRSRLCIFKSCPNLIRTLPSLRRDRKNPGDASTEPHELTHAPDALRYFLAGRPAPDFSKRTDVRTFLKPRARVRF